MQSLYGPGAGENQAPSAVDPELISDAAPNKVTHALSAARLGRIFPLKPSSGEPLIPNWHQVARGIAHEKEIRAVWAKCPDANIGMALDDIFVLEFPDVGSFEAARSRGLLATFAQRTPEGRVQAFIRAKEPPLVEWPGVRIAGPGGFAILAGSTVPEGEYSVLHDAPISDASECLRPKVSQTGEDIAVDFLQKLRPRGPWVLTAIKPDGPTKTVTARTADEVRSFVRAHNGKRNLYYSVNPTRGATAKKAAKTDIAAIEYALADLDPAEGESSTEARARYLTQLKNFQPQPTAIINSGNGIQALWRLKEPIVLAPPRPNAKGKADFSPEDGAIIADVEARIADVMVRLGAKPGTQNIDRILRLPGTINRNCPGWATAGFGEKILSTEETGSDSSIG